MNSDHRSDSAVATTPGLTAAQRTLLQRRFAPREGNGHELIALTLRELGLSHVFAVSGTPIHETLARCATAGVRPIGMHHQQSAVLAALAQNYLAGGLRGVPVFSAGPAVTNGVTGALFAQDNCWPLLALGGRRPVRQAGQGEFQDLDATPLFAPVTKHAGLVRQAGELAAALRAGARTALSGRPGPVYLDLADEALAGMAAWTPAEECEPDAIPEPSEGDIARAADLLRHAARPAVIFGKGVRWDDAFVELRALVEWLHAPFVASPMGRGLLPDDHPLAFTTVGGAVQAGADVVLMVGARWNWQFRFGSQLAPGARVVTLDIHPPEIGRGIAPAVGLVGDAKRVLRRLLEQLRASGDATPHPDAARAAWLATLVEHRATAARALASASADERTPMGFHRVMAGIAGFLPAGAITILDGHLSMLAAQDMIPARAPLTRLTVGSNGCIGVGLPFAIGAKLLHPERLVVAICGDSAFGFCALELETAVRHRIPFVVVVADNQGLWGAHIQRRYYPPDHERVVMSDPAVRYDRLAESLGAHGELVEVPSQLRPALDRAAAAGRPACVHVRLDPLAVLPAAPRF